MRLSDPEIRKSSERWSQMFLLLQSLQKAFEVAARMDAYADREGWLLTETKKERRLRDATVWAFDAQIVRLERLLDVEFDKLTADRLRLDLRTKILLCCSDPEAA